jgi:hypothetical protein
MKRLTITALLSAQLLAAAQPAMAAQLEATGDQRMGAFGGLRVRLPLGGEMRDRQLRAGLTLAPTLHGRLANGETRLRFGEGLELGLRGREPVRLSLAGRDVRRLAARDDGDGRRGIPTGALIAGGLVLVTIAGVVFVAVALENADDSD